MSRAAHAPNRSRSAAGRAPYSKGLMARALMAAGVPRRAGVRARVARRAGPARARGGRGRPRPARRSSRVEVLGEDEGAQAIRAAPPLREPARARPARSSSSSAARPAPASRRSRPRSPTGSASRASRRPTSSGRRCARSSRGVHAVDPLLELRGRRGLRSAEEEAVDAVCSASSSRRATSSSACDASIDRALAGGLVDGARGRSPRSRACCAPIEGALVVQCVLAIEDEEVHARALLGPRRASDGLRPVEKYLDAPRRHPRAPGLHPRAGAAGRRAGDREQGTWSGRSATVMELVLDRAPSDWRRS